MSDATREGSALVIGEVLVDVVRRPDGTVESHPGGSPANVAIGLGRLGRDVSLLTSVGKDPHGDMVRAHLEDSSVALVEGSADAPRTSVATATLDGEGAATYDFDLAWDIDAGAATRTDPVVVHTGSIAAVLAPGGDAVVEILESVRDRATITYDPNARPALMGDPGDALAAIERVVALADVVKASDEDLAWLLTGRPSQGAGTDAGQADAIGALAREWATRGPAVVVVTKGGDGATAYLSNGRHVSVDAPRVEVADTVGAGDSFMSGLIDGLWEADLLGSQHRDELRGIDEATVTGVLERCARIGAITVSRAGANPPTRAELGEA
ncbi:carbohydrate kinase family protein [Demequina sp. SO4-18]|uniref:carbohydrate kinase family protein n=1 Tax=Demequina sp. SO4-18 TaxID=3401026 RepID=UPI003B5B5988